MKLFTYTFGASGKKGIERVYHLTFEAENEADAENWAEVIAAGLHFHMDHEHVGYGCVGERWKGRK